MASRADAVVHELLHLKHPNHGKVFKTMVKAYLAGESRGDEPRDD